MHKKGRILRNFCFVLFLLLCVNLGYAKLEIIVKSSPDWGPISDADVEYLCQEIADRFEEHLRSENEIFEAVNVSRNLARPGVNLVNLDIADPHVKYKIGVWLEDDMQLKEMKEFWSFITGFGHEFTHILQLEQKNVDYGDAYNQNVWFQEVIAELGCVWVMQSMADTWKHGSRFGTGIPVPGGISVFSENFAYYADWYTQLHPYSGTGQEWLAVNEDSLRDQFNKNSKSNRNYTDMILVRQLYPKFLSIFEKNPEAWNAVRKMPVMNTEKMDRYMQVWYEAVDVQDRQYVEAIAEVMGITVTAPVLVSVESDAAEFVHLTFTHKSDTSLTPVNNSNDWDGWVAGIWEKTPDGQISKKSNHYYNFQGMDIWSHWAYSSAPATIEYDISSGAYTKFSSYFGVPHQGPDYACLGGPSMQLVAYADNIEIYRSDVLYRDNHGAYIEFDVPSKTKTLKLEIGDVENQHCDNYIFGEPKLYTDSAAGLEAGNIDADVNNDGRVDLLDVQIVRKAINGSSNYDTDVNNDGVTDEADIFIVKAFAHAAIVAASPGKRKVNITTWGNLKRR